VDVAVVHAREAALPRRPAHIGRRARSASELQRAATYCPDHLLACVRLHPRRAARRGRPGLVRAAARSSFCFSPGFLVDQPALADVLRDPRRALKPGRHRFDSLFQRLGPDRRAVGLPRAVHRGAAAQAREDAHARGPAVRTAPHLWPMHPGDVLGVGRRVPRSFAHSLSAERSDRLAIRPRASPPGRAGVTPRPTAGARARARRGSERSAQPPRASGACPPRRHPRHAA
jgi:hypothetical protein